MAKSSNRQLQTKYSDIDSHSSGDNGSSDYSDDEDMFKPTPLVSKTHATPIPVIESDSDVSGRFTSRSVKLDSYCLSFV